MFNRISGYHGLAKLPGKLSIISIHPSVHSIRFFLIQCYNVQNIRLSGAGKEMSVFTLMVLFTTHNDVSYIGLAYYLTNNFCTLLKTLLLSLYNFPQD